MKPEDSFPDFFRICARVCVCVFFFYSGFKLEKSVECFAFQVSDFLPVNLKRQIFSYVFFSICNFQCSHIQILKIQVAEILISIYDIQFNKSNSFCQKKERPLMQQS